MSTCGSKLIISYTPTTTDTENWPSWKSAGLCWNHLCKYIKAAGRIILSCGLIFVSACHNADQAVANKSWFDSAIDWVDGEWNSATAPIGNALWTVAYYGILAIFVIGAVFGLFRWAVYRINKMLELSERKAMARIDANLSTAVDRAIKLNEIEFRIIPDTWAALYDTRNKIITIGDRFSPGPIEMMDTESYAKYIGNFGLDDYIQNQIKASPSDRRRAELDHAIRCQRSKEAHEALSRLKESINRNMIIFSPNMVSRMNTLYQMMARAHAEFDNSLQGINCGGSAMEKLMTDGNTVAEAIRTDLWNYFNSARNI